MIKIVPEKIPHFQLKQNTVDDWEVLCEGRVIAKNLSEYLARMFFASGPILQFLSTCSKREHAPLTVPIRTLLSRLGIEFHFGE